MLAAAVDDGLIARNPCGAGSVKPPRIVARKVEPWPVGQVLAVIDALPARYRAVAVVAAGCGLRQGEAFGLRVGDIDFLRHRLRVDQQVKIVRGCLQIDSPKGGKTRVVPSPNPLPSPWRNTFEPGQPKPTVSFSPAGSAGLSIGTTSTPTFGGPPWSPLASNRTAPTACTPSATSTPRC